MESENMTRYFVAKCANIQGLQTCIANSRWACKDRVTSPSHPREILTSAFESSPRVVIIFSVNNCHGWHGYVEMLTTPSQDEREIDKISENETKQDIDERDAKNDVSKSTSEIDKSEWYYFKVKWITEFSSKFGEQCLPFQKTTSIVCCDGIPLNKARNWNEIDDVNGKQLCTLIDEHYCKLQAKHEEKLKLHESRLPPPFIKTSWDVNNFKENWSQLVKKVENELGPVILACPFGSQRYNLDTEKSDMDMFVVYQANTQTLLGFDKQPPQTVKSSDREELDYTIHEVYRYGELLLAGDHRCVETLFLHDTSYIESSDAFKHLLKKRNLFLNSLCLEKYLRDALGNKGLKLYEKWIKERSKDEPMTERESKLAYIIIRLLQNAKNIVDNEKLQVYRPDDCPDRKFLMSLKTDQNQLTIQYAFDEIMRLKDYIDENKERVPSASEQNKDFMNEWILDLRKTSLL